MDESLDGIAIIGLAGRFPGAANVEDFWSNLRDGVESISRYSDNELLTVGVSQAALENPNYVKAGTEIEGLDLFDAGFFGLGPREARVMDPQQRHFLEVAWEALERSGYDPAVYGGAIGVFAGAGMNKYLQQILNAETEQDVAGAYLNMIGNDKDYLATRVSYQLDLRGPSLTVQTACSTSLVAVHLACQNLLTYQCDMALAGGVSIDLPQGCGYFSQEGMILSHDGHVRTFDKAGQGIVVGRGVGIVVLKRLSEALEDGDHIHAVIRGSAINNDGAAKVGYTAPSIDGQAEVIAAAQAMAGVEPRSIGYIEAHGTATPLGDPIEIAALTRVFRRQTSDTGFCAIGSVKTNLGHLDAAAGVAGLMKATLALEKEEIPPSLNFEEPNPEIDFCNSPFVVNTRLRSWPRNEAVRRAGVSAFGIGGTNAHVVLEEAPLRGRAAASPRPYELLLLSARSKDTLKNASRRLGHHLAAMRANEVLADAAFTLACGRRAFAERRALVCTDAAEGADVLISDDNKRAPRGTADEVRRDLVFLFSGQGAQYPNMGRELYECDGIFRETVDNCAITLREPLGIDLRDLLYPETEKRLATAKLNETAFTQPALFTIEYALAQQLMAWGLVPSAFVGHSIGEYVAACLSGVFSLEAALRLVAERGRLMQSLPIGSMLAIPLPEAEVCQLLGPGCELAAVNGPAACVVSGQTTAIKELEEALSAQGMAAKRLFTSHAFHSEMMEPILAPFMQAVLAAGPQSPELPFVSNVSGTWITETEATDPAYWAQHLRQTVRFADCVTTLLEGTPKLLLEVGPGGPLTTLARQSAPAESQVVILSSLPQAKEEMPAYRFLLTQLGRIWMAGYPVDWQAFYADEARRRMPLPTYPFERQSYWPPKMGETAATATASTAEQNLEQKKEIGEWIYAPSWERAALSDEAISEGSLAKSWLILEKDDGLSAALRTALKDSGCSVVSLRLGSTFAVIGENSYEIEPNSLEPVGELIASLAAADRLPTAVLHAWSLGGSVEPVDLETLNESQNTGTYVLMDLARAFANNAPGHEVIFYILADGLQDVTGGEILHPEKATILGPCKVIPLEYQEFSCRCIDVTADDAQTGQQARLLSQILAELAAASDDKVVALRGGYRWIETVSAMPIPGSEAASRLKDDGVYLITGGLGGIGLDLADFIARNAKRAKLVLLDLKALSAPDELGTWQSTGYDDDPTSQMVRAVASMEEVGAQVLTLAADVADQDAMRNALDHALRRFGRIDGVIHAAGVIDNGGIIHRRTREMNESIIRSKVRGTLVLESLFADQVLDFFILCSSISTVLYHNTFAQSGDIAANSFLDVFGQSGRMGARTINWCGWRGVGMLARGEVAFREQFDTQEELLDERDQCTREEGVELFSRILSSDLRRTVISPRDLRRRLATDHLIQSPFLAAVEKKGQAPLSKDNPSETMAAIICEVLGLSEVSFDDDFYDLGGDSLLAMMVVARAARAGFSLTAQQLFEHRTIEEMVLVMGRVGDDKAGDNDRGPIPLTPNQLRFLGRNSPDSHQWNLSSMVEWQSDLDPIVLEKAVTALVEQHEVLRLRFWSNDEGWHQEPIRSFESLPFESHDFSSLAEEVLDEHVASCCRELQSNFVLSQGPLFRLIHFRLGHSRPDRIVLIVHHLIADQHSYGLLLEDLEEAYMQIQAGEPVQLQRSSGTFRRWAIELLKYMDSPDAQKDIALWAALPWTGSTSLPRDLPGSAEDNTNASACVLTRLLPSSLRNAFLRDRNYVPQDFLLAALHTTIAEWTGSSVVLIDLLHHGREMPTIDLDLSRTVGMFISYTPLVLQVEDSNLDILKVVAEQASTLKERGWTFYTLRQMGSAHGLDAGLESLPQPEFLLNYRGVSLQSSYDALRVVDWDHRWSMHSPRGLRHHPLAMTVDITEKGILNTLIYSKNLHNAKTMERFMNTFCSYLEGFLRAGELDAAS